jgi:formamidase
MVAGRYALPWEHEVVHTDGTSCGFARPSRRFGDAKKLAAE